MLILNNEEIDSLLSVDIALYAEAKAKGVGREIPTDWFLETVHP